jgi:tetratricopeptide (TPR) repeat protein
LNLQFYRGRGLALAELGRFEAALADGEHLVSTAGHLAESHYVRGRALQGLGRHAEAVRDFTTAIAIRPELVYPLAARAASYAALGDDRAQADLAAAASVRDAHRRCAPCVDPFRY